MAKYSDEDFDKWQENVSLVQNQVSKLETTIATLSEKIEALPDHSPTVTKLQEQLETATAALQAAETRLAELEKTPKPSPEPNPPRNDAGDRPAPAPEPPAPAKAKVRWT